MLGRLVPETLYEKRDWKRGAAVAVLALGAICQAALQFLYVGVLAYWPAAAAAARGGGAEEVWPVLLSIVLALSFVGGPVWNARAMETKRSKYVAVKLIRISPDAYMRGTLAYRYIVFGLAFAAALSVFAAMAGRSPLEGALLAAALTGWRLFAERLHLLLYRKKGVVLIKNNPIALASLLGGAALAYGPLLAGEAPEFGGLLLALPTQLACVALGAWAAVQLARYPHYADAVDASVKRDDPLLNLGQMMADAKKADVAAKEADYKAVLSAEEPISASPAATGQRGYARLNALFFRRHRRLIAKPLYNRLALVGAAGIAAAALLAAFGSPRNWTLLSLLPYLPFACYTISLGERLCRALFYNCDMPLLRYAFYREAAAKHFGWRLLRLTGMNLLLGAAIGAALTAVAAIAGWPLDAGHLLPLWLTIAGLFLLMSVHHLLLYYMLQPYTTELNAKNPLFFLLNVALSSVCWIALVFRPHPAAIAAGSIALAALYLAAAWVLVRRKGPKTFRLK